MDTLRNSLATDDHPSTPLRVAIRSNGSAEEREHVHASLRQRGIQNPIFFPPKDDDKLNDAVAAGQFNSVIFPTLESLLAAAWKNEIKYEDWLKRGITIEIASLALPSDQVRQICHELARWRRSENRRKITASVILSILAVASVAILISLLLRTG